MEAFVAETGLGDDDGPDLGEEPEHRRLNGELHAAIKKMDVNTVRSMLTGSFEDSLESCFRSRSAFDTCLWGGT